MLTEALAGLRASSKKPDIPAFDPKNIDLWIKRVDNAYRRANITDPKDKFAFLETKFSVDVDPCINAFIFGEGTEASWSAFTKYLHERYGRTKQQRAAVVLDGVRRDGRKPSEMFAHIMERIGDLTLDDVVKEMVVRELPTEVQRVLHDRYKDLSGAEAVKLADTYFDKDGKPIHKPSVTSVSHVEEASGLIETTDDEGDGVNTLGARPRHRNQRPRPGPPSSRPNQFAPRPSQPSRQQPSERSQRPAFTPAFDTRTNPRASPTERHENRGPPTVKSVRLCKFHDLFGNEARTCEPGCDRYANWSKAKAGRQA